VRRKRRSEDPLARLVLEAAADETTRGDYDHIALEACVAVVTEAHAPLAIIGLDAARSAADDVDAGARQRAIARSLEPKARRPAG